jgi:hypothetical protein
MISYIRHNLVLQNIAFLALLDWILVLHIVPQIQYLGFSHLREEGSLDYDGEFVRLQVHFTTWKPQIGHTTIVTGP